MFLLAIVCGLAAAASALGALIFGAAALRGDVENSCSGNGVCEALSTGGLGLVIGIVLAAAFALLAMLLHGAASGDLAVTITRPDSEDREE